MQEQQQKNHLLLPVFILRSNHPYSALWVSSALSANMHEQEDIMFFSYHLMRWNSSPFCLQTTFPL